jgi:hypothetical protein
VRHNRPTNRYSRGPTTRTVRRRRQPASPVPWIVGGGVLFLCLLFWFAFAPGRQAQPGEQATSDRDPAGRAVEAAAGIAAASQPPQPPAAATAPPSPAQTPIARADPIKQPQPIGPKPAVKPEPAQAVTAAATIRAVRTTYSVATKMKRCPQVSVTVVRPVDATGETAVVNGRIVGAVGWPSLRDWNGQGWLDRVAVEGRAIVVAPAYLDMNAADMNPYDRSAFYYFPESGAPDVLKDAVAKARAEYGLPERPLALVGISGGGSAVQNWAGADDSWIDGFASFGSNSPDLEKFAHKPQLLLANLEDSADASARDMAQALAKANVPYRHFVTMPEWGGRGRSIMFSHPPDEATKNLWTAWTIDLLEARDSAGKTWESARNSWRGGARTDSAAKAVPKAPRIVTVANVGPVLVVEPGEGAAVKALIVFGGQEQRDSLERSWDAQYVAGLGCVAAIPLGLVGKQDSLSAVRKSLGLPSQVPAALVDGAYTKWHLATLTDSEWQGFSCWVSSGPTAEPPLKPSAQTLVAIGPQAPGWQTVKGGGASPEALHQQIMSQALRGTLSQMIR